MEVGEVRCPGPQPNSLGWDLGHHGKLWNGRNGRSGRLSNSTDGIGAPNVDLYGKCVWLRPVLWVHGQWQCCYGSCFEYCYYIYNTAEPALASFSDHTWPVKRPA